MATTTTKYGFKKPSQDDFYNIDDQNKNWDSVDVKLSNIESQMADITNKTSGMIKIANNVLISTSSWTQQSANLWKADINNTNITANSIVDVNVRTSYIEAAKYMKSNTDSSAGKVTVYASKKPTSSIYADLKIIKEVS